jgi:hypothetical protein
MLEQTPTGTRENGPYDMWDKCLEESKKIPLEYEFPDKPEGEKGRILTPRRVNENGEPEYSRLPVIYAKIVRTPTFLKWFGDWTQTDKTSVSKAVYLDTGEPKLFFHGTTKDVLPELGIVPRNDNDKKREPQIFTSQRIDVSKQYMLDYESDQYTGTMFSFFVNIKRPAKPGREYEAFIKNNPEQEDGLLWSPDVERGEDVFAIVNSADKIMHLPSHINNNPLKVDVSHF